MRHVELLKLYYYSYLYFPGHLYFLYHISHSAVHNSMFILYVYMRLSAGSCSSEPCILFPLSHSVEAQT